MNIHTYLEKTAKKASLRKRLAKYLESKVIPPTVAFTQGALEGGLHTYLMPIETSKRIYGKKARESLKKMYTDKNSVEAMYRAPAAGSIVGNLSALASIPYGVKKVKNYIQDKRRGQ